MKQKMHLFLQVFAVDSDSSNPHPTPGLRLSLTVLRNGPLMIERLTAVSEDIDRRSTQSLIGVPLHERIISPQRSPALEAGEADFTLRIDAPETDIYSS